jgi:hypothetical protein
MARRLGWVAAVALLIAAMTVLVFLVRAGDSGATNWPEQFELRSSDNGVLFQFAQDVFAGRNLDWSFSPQVFVFPEIPISIASYAIACGSVQGYYLVGASINNALLFLALFAVVRYLFPREALGRRLLRSCVCMFPLLVLPLIGTTWLFSYSLAPTYYFGMYLVIFAAPALFLARASWVRVLVGLGVALAGASNPLLFVFVLPAAAVVVIAGAVAVGPRHILSPVVWGAACGAVAFAIRLVLLSRLQGGSPLDYIDPVIFGGRMQVVDGYLRGLLSAPSTGVVVVIGSIVAVGGLCVAAVVFVMIATGRWAADVRRMCLIFFGLIPLGGLAGTLALQITDYLYLWPVLIAPLVLAFVWTPGGWLPWVASATSACLVVVAAVTGAGPNLVEAGRYFTYRSAETRCLDSNLPTGVTIGYATFSDARRLELTSARPFRLIQLKSSGVRAYWLTNRDYARDSVGRFFYINDKGDEPAISMSYLEEHFGMPDRRFTCGAGKTVLIYDQPAKLAKIKARYSALPAP